MKTIVRITLITLLLLGCLNAQSQLIITCGSDSVPIRIKPINGSKPIIRINTGTKLKAISQTNGFVKVIYKVDTGYMSRSFIKELSDAIYIKADDYKAMDKHTKFCEKLNDLPDENPTIEFNKIIENYTDETIPGANKIYGLEDNRSEFHTGDYYSITLIWYCAKGAYRSITFKRGDEGYKKESEYTSNCH